MLPAVPWETHPSVFFFFFFLLASMYLTTHNQDEKPGQF